MVYLYDPFLCSIRLDKCIAQVEVADWDKRESLTGSSKSHYK